MNLCLRDLRRGLRGSDVEEVRREPRKAPAGLNRRQYELGYGGGPRPLGVVDTSKRSDVLGIESRRATDRLIERDDLDRLRDSRSWREGSERDREPYGAGKRPKPTVQDSTPSPTNTAAGTRSPENAEARRR